MKKLLVITLITAFGIGSMHTAYPQKGLKPKYKELSERKATIEKQIKDIEEKINVLQQANTKLMSDHRENLRENLPIAKRMLIKQSTYNNDRQILKLKAQIGRLMGELALMSPW